MNVGIFTNVDNLKITKKEQEEGFVKHIVENADIMYRFVVQNLEFHPHLRSQTSTYKANLKEAFGKIADSYITLQETWSDEDDIVVVDEEPEVDQDDEKKRSFLTFLYVFFSKICCNFFYTCTAICYSLQYVV